jgi:hypothetical protein
MGCTAGTSTIASGSVAASFYSEVVEVPFRPSVNPNTRERLKGARARQRGVTTTVFCRATARNGGMQKYCGGRLRAGHP